MYNFSDNSDINACYVFFFIQNRMVACMKRLASDNCLKMMNGIVNMHRSKMRI